MPELPEVETVRRGLTPALEGQRILRAQAFRPDLRWPLPERFAERLSGRQVLRLRRRSKYLLADLDSGETWITHLGMSGRILLSQLETDRAEAATLGDFHHDVGEGRGPHDHVVLETATARITYNDARRFGAMDLWPTEDLDRHRLLAAIGPEPLSNAFHAGHLAERLKGRTMSIKAALLDQRLVAGLGNIYVCEALWRAAISPKRAAGSISAARLERLTTAIRDVLEEAIAAGGSSLKDYRQTDGELGYFQHRFAVYDREGEPCRREGCAGSVDRIVQSARSSFYCGRCQR